MSESVVAVLMAAGKARRFGSDKRSALVYYPPLKSELPLMLISYLKLCAKLERVVVLLAKSEMDDIKGLFAQFGCQLRPQDRFCGIEQRPVSGLGDSIAQAASFIASEFPRSAMLVALADMPAIKQSSLEVLLNRWRAVDCQAMRLVSCIDGQERAGHPVIFSSTVLGSLKALSGDNGAKAVLQTMECELVKVNDIGVLADVDKPEQLPVIQAILLEDTPD